MDVQFMYTTRAFTCVIGPHHADRQPILDPLVARNVEIASYHHRH